MPSLLVKGITKSFDGVPVLHSVNFKSNEPARIIGLIGPNGAGKTTLMEAIAGLIPIESGSATWDEKELFALRPGIFCFYIADQSFPDQNRPVAEVLDFYRNLYSMKIERVREIVSDLELSPILSKRISQLSKGFRKRLLLAVAFIVPHPLVLVDEPFDGLDFRQVRQIAVLFKERYAKDKTFLLSIHQLHDASITCDYFVLLQAGSVVAEGQLSDVLRTKEKTVSTLEEAFLAYT